MRLRYPRYFTRVVKSAGKKYWLINSCPYIRLPSWNISAAAGQIFMKFCIGWFYHTLSTELKVLKLGQTTNAYMSTTYNYDYFAD
jgi:hypothetical protein